MRVRTNIQLLNIHSTMYASILNCVRSIFFFFSFANWNISVWEKFLGKHGAVIPLSCHGIVSSVSMRFWNFYKIASVTGVIIFERSFRAIWFDRNCKCSYFAWIFLLIYWDCTRVTCSTPWMCISAVFKLKKNCFFQPFSSKDKLNHFCLNDVHFIDDSNRNISEFSNMQIFWSSQHVCFEHIFWLEFNCICLCTPIAFAVSPSSFGFLIHLTQNCIAYFLDFISYFNLHALEQMRTLFFTAAAYFVFYMFNQMRYVRCHRIFFFFSFAAYAQHKTLSYILRHIFRLVVYVRNHFHLNIFLRIWVF